MLIFAVYEKDVLPSPRIMDGALCYCAERTAVVAAAVAVDDEHGG